MCGKHEDDMRQSKNAAIKGNCIQDIKWTLLQGTVNLNSGAYNGIVQRIRESGSCLSNSTDTDQILNRVEYECYVRPSYSCSPFYQAE